MDKYNKTIGFAGEKLAAKYLKKKGYKILDTNYIVRGGEIDIIAFKDDYVVFVEVKTRTNVAFGTPLEAVGFVKQKRMKIAARFFMMNYGEVNIRFDVIGINCETDGNKIKKSEINHIINAFS